jgi:hypothetical protein
MLQTTGLRKSGRKRWVNGNWEGNDKYQCGVFFSFDSLIAGIMMV